MYATLAVISAFATYRLSVMFARDDGPLDCFKRMREWLAAESLHNQGIGFVHSLVTCPRCNSVWIGLGMATIFAAELQAPIWVLPCALAFSGAAMWLDSQIP